MICIICKGEIDKQYNNKGVMYWDQGHNAQPVADGQCCNRCNEDIVIPMRMTDMKMTMYGNLYEEDK
tara:strand:+ start:766 stop:966 length:201 start_codon:yes stop_codon:yes gene_type:complete